MDLVDQAQISVPPSEAGAGEGIVDPLAQPQFGSTGNIGSTEVEVKVEEPDVDRQARTRQPTDYSVQTRTSDDGLPLGASASQIGAGPGGAPTVSEEKASAAPLALNFLQEDELVQQSAEPLEEVPASVIAEVSTEVDISAHSY